MNTIKKISKKICLGLSLLLASSTLFAGVSYVIDNEHSIVNFSVTKKQYIIEPAVFQDVEGSIDAKGNAVISIDMNSVDSSNPIRDNRLIDMFFQAEFFPTAIINAKIDDDILNSKEMFQTVKIAATLELFEIKKDITLDVMISKMGKNIMVTSLKPIIVNAKMFDLPTENLAALSKVCGGIAISDIVPVNFVLVFKEK